MISNLPETKPLSDLQAKSFNNFCTSNDF